MLAAETNAGVGHHVTLSIVGVDRLPDSGYMRAKLAQEHVVKAGAIPYTVVRATQFFEFIGRIAEWGADGDTELDDRSLTPGDDARIPPTRFEDWLSRSVS